MDQVVQHWVTAYGYGAIFLLMAASSACIPVPSEVILLVGGWYAATGRLSALWVVLFGLAGNLVGSLVTFWIGLALGRGFLDRYGRYLLIRSHDIDRAERWWRSHGEAATFLCRMIPVLRTYISIAAGVAGMDPSRFIWYTIAGIIPWTVGLVAAGWIVQDSWERIASFFTAPSLAAAAIGVATAAWWWVARRRREGRTEGAATD